MSVRDQLIRVLADGEFHSGAALALTLGVSRAAVWKQVHQLGSLGLGVETSRSGGYRFTRPIELLDPDRILGELRPTTRAACESLEVAGVTVSTSVTLAAQRVPAPDRWRCTLAEYQTGGRGRRGRRWHSPYGSGICLSLGWCFERAPADLPALSLAAGIGVLRALAAAGASAITLKWPNDVMYAGRKLGGILVDVDGEARGPLRAVVGVGLNVGVPAPLAEAVGAEGGLPPAGLEEAVARPVGRNALAAGLLEALYAVLQDFAQHGFAPLADEWRHQDFLYGRAVTVRSGGEELQGIARGVGVDGSLLLDGPAGSAKVLNGDVTLRR